MKVGLADLLQDLRSELTEAMRDGTGSDMRFEIGTVELELSVQVQKEARPGAKVRFWVVEAGAEAAVTATSAHTIRLSLEPRLASAPNRRPLIAGAEVEGERVPAVTRAEADGGR
ncbi:trypco2 family protein [Streptomyces sp. NPDC048002]|uniref:trypco2 family protein n=1 Tax=unclassified Streptomyces TaxID=2593676 RepID=UPI0033F3CD7C